MQDSADIRIDALRTGEIGQQKRARRLARKASWIDVRELYPHRCERTQEANGLVTDSQRRGELESRVLGERLVEWLAGVPNDEIGLASTRSSGLQHRGHPGDSEPAHQTRGFLVGSELVQARDLHPDGPHRLEPNAGTPRVSTEDILSIRRLLEEHDAIEALRLEKLEPSLRRAEIGVLA